MTQSEEYPKIKGATKMDINRIISQMTLEEKITLGTGADSWHTKAMPQHGIKSIKMADGPHGLRNQEGKTDMIGINESTPATCFPPAVTAAATWNKELYAKEGEAIGKEAAAAGVSVVLGPGCNIKRNPLGGRNFEYISEDPYMAGKMAAAFINGQQSVGVSSSLKHFAANSQEYKRQNGNSLLDERTLREIYLTAFEIAVKESKPGTVMCAYNKINGTHCSDDKRLLTEILRNDWGFDGLVVTDWGAMNDRIAGYEAGCDLNMPGGSKYMEKAVMEAVKNGKLDESHVDQSVVRLLKLIEKSEDIQKPKQIDWQAHHELAQIIAEQGAVLLKNEDQILPLDSKDIVIIGNMAKEMRYQGTGSSHINPKMICNLTDALPEATICLCGDKEGHVSEAEIEAAKQAAKQQKIPVIVVGLPESYESEALDRQHMRLPEGYNHLVSAVAEVNENTVVVLLGGSPVELPWADQVKAILYMGLPGQAGGQAIANLITGEAAPCGKLTETWPLSYEDVICKDTFGQKDPEYREGIYVGYRYYEKAKKPVRFPFGYGLSYTSFEYRNLKIDGHSAELEVQNTGTMRGAEVVQLYIAPPQDGLHRSLRELKGFERVELDSGETAKIRFELDERSFAVWNDGWQVPEGNYRIEVGASSQDIRLSQKLYVAGVQLPKPAWQEGSWYETLQDMPSREIWERLMGRSVPIAAEPKKGEFTMDNTCLEMKPYSLVMKVLYVVTKIFINRGFKGERSMDNPAYRMMITQALDCPLRAMVICGGGALSDGLAKGLLYMANGQFFRAIKAMFR